MDFTLSPSDKELVAAHSEDLDAATEAVLSRLTDSLRPQLRLQVQREINWNATYRDIQERERAAHHYRLCCPASNSTSTRPVYEDWRVPVDLLDAFAKEHRLDKGQLLKLANGETQEYKKWIAHPNATGKYLLNKRPKPATDHPSLAEGVIGPLLPLDADTGRGDPRKTAPTFLATKTYKE
jgi:hypothetical protein